MRFFKSGNAQAECLDDDAWPHVQFEDVGAPRSSALLRARTQARAIISALERRRSIMLAVACEIARIQTPMFVANEPLRALSGRDLSRSVGCSESTVSRVLANRYVHTPLGTLPMRALLDRHVGRSTLGTHAIQSELVQILRDAPSFSDAQISRALALRGIRMARRTVAKYRRGLRVPTCYERSRL